MKKKRSTMSVNIFKETTDKTLEFKPADIFKKLCEYEQKYTTNDNNTIKEVQEFDFSVPRIRNFNKGSYGLNLIDIPGFNDRTSNQILLDWLHNKISLFDIILYMIDINSALNTESEIKLLDCVLESVCEYAYVPIIFLFNKYDNADDEELIDMFNTAVNIIKTHCKSKKVDISRVHFVKISAELAYIYRHIYFHKNLADLSNAQIRTLSVEEFGKSGKDMNVKTLEKRLFARKMNYKDITRQMPGYVEFEQIFNKLLNNDMYYQKVQKLLGFVHNKFVDASILNYVIYIAQNKTIESYCRTQISNVLRKYVLQSDPLSLTQFIMMIMPNIATLRNYANADIKTVFIKKSKEMICPDKIIEWYALFKKPVHSAFNDEINIILEGYFKKKQKKDFIKNFGGLKTFIDIIVTFHANILPMVSPYLVEYISNFSKKCVIDIDFCTAVYDAFNSKCSPIISADDFKLYDIMNVLINALYIDKDFNIADFCVRPYNIVANDLEKLAALFVKMKRYNDEIFNKFVIKSIQISEDHWYIYLLFRDLIEHNIIQNIPKQFKLYSAIKYAHFDFLGDIASLLACNYSCHEFRSFKNIIDFFVGDNTSGDDGDNTNDNK